MRSASSILHLACPCLQLSFTSRETNMCWSSQPKERAGIFRRMETNAKEMRAVMGLHACRTSSTWVFPAAWRYTCAVHVCTCQPHVEVQYIASDGSRGDCILVSGAEHLQGTVIGMQGQQMLLCAQDLLEGTDYLPRSQEHPKEKARSCVLLKTTNSFSHQSHFCRNRLEPRLQSSQKPPLLARGRHK